MEVQKFNLFVSLVYSLRIHEDSRYCPVIVSAPDVDTMISDPEGIVPNIRIHYDPTTCSHYVLDKYKDLAVDIMDNSEIEIVRNRVLKINKPTRMDLISRGLEYDLDPYDLPIILLNYIRCYDISKICLIVYDPVINSDVTLLISDLINDNKITIKLISSNLDPSNMGGKKIVRRILDIARNDPNITNKLP